jgi:hypothetical protein
MTLSNIVSIILLILNIAFNYDIINNLKTNSNRTLYQLEMISLLFCDVKIY